MHTDCIIRKAEEADLITVADIEDECFSSSWNLSALMSEFENSYSCIYLAVTDGNISGYLIMYVIEDEAEIARIGVKNEYRRKGIASAMINKSLENFEGDVYIDVRIKNKPACFLYLKLGFDQIYLRKNYYSNPTEDAVVMKKHIGDKK